MRITAILFLGFSGCANSPEACAAPKLADIEARRVSEAVDKCKGFGWSKCPDHDAIEAKYDAEREQVKKECRK